MNKPAKKAPRGRRKLPPADNDSPLLWGAEAIGAYINRSPKQIYHLHALRRIPTRSVGATIVARRVDLDNLADWPGQDGAA